MPLSCSGKTRADVGPRVSAGVHVVPCARTPPSGRDCTPLNRRVRSMRSAAEKERRSRRNAARARRAEQEDCCRAPGRSRSRSTTADGRRCSQTVKTEESRAEKHADDVGIRRGSSRRWIQPPLWPEELDSARCRARNGRCLRRSGGSGGGRRPDRGRKLRRLATTAAPNPSSADSSSGRIGQLAQVRSSIARPVSRPERRASARKRWEGSPVLDATPHRYLLGDR